MATAVRHGFVLPVLVRNARSGRALVCAGLAVLVSGCAGGIDAPSLDLVGSHGYTLTAAEMRWNCPALENAVQARVTRITALNQQAKAEQAATPPTLSRFFTRLSGEPDSPALTEIKSERTAADAYNRELKTKGCAPVDLDAKLAGIVPVPPAAADITPLPPALQGVGKH